MPIPGLSDSTPLISAPNTRTLDMGEVLHRLKRFIDKIADVEFVLLVKRKSDGLDRIGLVRGSNTTNSAVRDLLRGALTAFDKGRVHTSVDP